MNRENGIPFHTKYERRKNEVMREVEYIYKIKWHKVKRGRERVIKRLKDVWVWEGSVKL